VGAIFGAWSTFISYFRFNSFKNDKRRIFVNNWGKKLLILDINCLPILLFSDIWSFDMHGFDVMFLAFSEIALGLVSKQVL
jgi:hypothetical protein